MKKKKRIKIGRSGAPRLAVLIQHVAGDPPGGTGDSPISGAVSTLKEDGNTINGRTRRGPSMNQTSLIVR